MEEMIQKLKGYEIEQLNIIKNEVVKEIDSRKKAMCIYKHECWGSAEYHRRKYKHFGKRLAGIDDTKTNGYAFLGEFLKVELENLVPVGSYIVEVCNYTLSLYRVCDSGKELLLEGTQNKYVSFIKEVKEITRM